MKINFQPILFRMPDPVSTGIGAAVGLAKSVTGIINNAKAKKEAGRLARSRPKYQISDLAGKDLSLAESELASGGLSATAENAYNNLNNKQFSASLGAILRGGGSVNNVADVFSANDEGRQKLALLTDQMRLNKIDRLSRAREMMRGEQDKAFEFNQWRPWADASQANAAARQQAQKDIWGGLDTVAGAGMQFFGGKYNEKQYDKYFGSPSVTNNSNPQVFNPSGLPNVQMPNTSNMYQINPYQPQPLRTSPRDNVYSYNWTPQNEMNQFQEDFGTIYQ